MDVLSLSTIVGYSCHLPTHFIKLPLKYHPKKPSNDASERFKNNCLGFSDLIDISEQSGHFFPFVQVGISEDLQSIRLCPIVLDEPTSLAVEFQVLNIALPHSIISKGTFTFQFVSSNNEEEPYILIDFIDQNYLMITLKIELSDFLVGNAKNRLVLDNFSEWVNISVPYSFELRSAPFFIKALSPVDIIVSLKDGGLLQFHRSTPLASFDIFNFNDIVPLISLSLVGNIFSALKRDETIVDGISAGACVDIVALNDQEFATLSVNKNIKIWDIKTHKQSQKSISLLGSISPSEWLTTIPNKYLQIRDRNGKKLLSVLLPTEISSQTIKSLGYQFVTWDVTEKGLTNADSFYLKDIISSEVAITTEVQHLKMQDFYIADEPKSINFNILLKCNNAYCFLASYEQDIISKAVISVSKSLHSSVFVFQDLCSSQSTQYYVNIIFNMGYFDENIVATALEIFATKFNVLSTLNSNSTLRQRVTHAISWVSKESGISESSTWYKFALICLEFRKTSCELLSISQKNNLIIGAQTDGIGIYRKAHFYETFMDSSTEDELSKIIKVISKKFSSKTFRNISSEILNLDSLNSVKAENLAARYLSKKISNDEISAITEHLSNIPDAVDKISCLIGNTDALEIDPEECWGISAGQGMGNLPKLLTVDRFESIKRSHEAVLIYLFVLLLLCEVNESVLNFLTLITRKLKIYDIMTEIFCLSFSSSTSSSGIENRSVSFREHCLFWNIAVMQSEGLSYLIQKGDYNAAFDWYCNKILIQDYSNFILNGVYELIKRSENALVFKQFVPHLDTSLPVNVFLVGLINLLNNNLEGFCEVFKNYDIFERVNKESIKKPFVQSMKGVARISDFTTSIFNDSEKPEFIKCNYYHQVSQLIKSYTRVFDEKVDSSEEDRSFKISKALQFEIMAIDSLDSINNQHERDKLMGLYVRSYFKDAIEIKQFPLAIQSLSKLEEISSKADFKSLMSKLLKSMIINHNFELIFDPNYNKIFSRHFLLTDSIILEFADENLVLLNALKCYEFLYAWRIFGSAVNGMSRSPICDRRGAAEALFYFVTRFRSEKENLGLDSQDAEDFEHFKLKILELYKIVLTTLKSFTADDDKWIRTRSNSNTLRISKLTELNIEYYQWLKELEIEFS